MTCSVSLVISVGKYVPETVVNEVCSYHQKQTIPLNIIVARLLDENFNLAKTRNLGANQAKTDWIIFSDVDTVYDRDLFERMIELKHDTVAGRSRMDVPTMEQIGLNFPTYECANSPILIRRELFDSVGGYCELYDKWGYEDSDFEHKLEGGIPAFDSRSYHILGIHRLTSTNISWSWGGDENRRLFESRMSIPISERIAFDISHRSIGTCKI